MKKKSYYFALIFFLLFFSVKMFSNSADSLRMLISNTTNDSLKVELHLELAKEFLPGNENYSSNIETAYKLAKKYDSPYLKALTNFYKGTLFNFYDEYDSAFVCFDVAIELFEAVQDTFFLAAVWGEKGNMFCFRAIYDDCLDCFLKSLRYTQMLDNKTYIAVTMNNIGSVYYLLDDFENALENYLHSFSVYQQLESDYGIALASNNIGSVYLEYYNDLDSANKYLRIAEQHAEKIEYYEQLAETTANLARLYGLQDSTELAREYYQKSISLNKMIGNRRGLAQSYISFASQYFFEELYVRAGMYLDSCVVLSEEIGALEYLTQSYKWKYMCDTAMGDYQKAFLNLLTFTELNDSIAKFEAQQNISTLKAEFNVEIKEKENQILLEKQAKQNLIIQRQKLYNIFITIALVLFIGLLFLLFGILKQRKRHFETLFLKNQEILQQKEEILTQNEVLNKQNTEIKLQNTEIEQHRNKLQKYQKDIQSSINYAKRIQSAILPDENEFLSVYSDFALLYEPKDIINGDFYFFQKFENKSVVVVADCTGHGVPGALMSILNMTLLKEVLREAADLTAAQTLDKVRGLVKIVLKQSSDMRTVHDGMDAALIIYDKPNKKINFSGAYRPLYHFSKNNLTILKSDRQPVSAHLKEKPFTDNFINVENEDVLYLFSDGIYDQISKDLTKKIGIKQFKELVISIQNLPLQTQIATIEQFWKKWKTDAVQTDDIIVLALKI
jgi:serine phosphatase RsbU (regulator of sigma subunit)/tetratricopeptide (TPR) repeat protein